MGSALWFCGLHGGPSRSPHGERARPARHTGRPTRAGSGGSSVPARGQIAVGRRARGELCRGLARDARDSVHRRSTRWGRSPGALRAKSAPRHAAAESSRAGAADGRSSGPRAAADSCTDSRNADETFRSPGSPRRPRCGCPGGTAYVRPPIGPVRGPAVSLGRSRRRRGRGGRRPARRRPDGTKQWRRSGREGHPRCGLPQPAPIHVCAAGSAEHVDRASRCRAVLVVVMSSPVFWTPTDQRQGGLPPFRVAGPAPRPLRVLEWAKWAIRPDIKGIGPAGLANAEAVAVVGWSSKSREGASSAFTLGRYRRGLERPVAWGKRLAMRAVSTRVRTGGLWDNRWYW